MELFGWTDKYSIKVHIAIGVAFLAFAVLIAALISFNVGKGTGDQMWVFPISAMVFGGIVLWRAKDRIERGEK